MFRSSKRDVIYSHSVTLYRAYGDFNVSHLGNAACMCVSIAWARWVENVEVGMGRIILFQKLRRLIINLLKSRDHFNLCRILKGALELMAVHIHGINTTQWYVLFCQLTLHYLEIFNYVFQFPKKRLVAVFLNV